MATPPSDEIREWFDQIDYWFERLQRKLPHIDPHDLRMILRSMHQPPSVPRRWLLRKAEGGRYVL